MQLTPYPHAPGSLWRPALSLPRATGLFAALVWISIAIPGLAIPKGMLILAYWLYLVLTARFSISSAIWLVSVAGSLLYPSVVGSFRSVQSSEVAGQFARLLFFFIALSIVPLIVQRDPRATDGEFLDKLIRRSAISSMLLKVAILGGVVAGLFTLDAAQRVLGFESVTTDIGMNLQRLQFPSDIAMIFLVACYRGRRRMIDVIFIISVSIVVYTSFSRFLFGAFAVALVTRALWLRTIDRTFIAAVLLAAVAAAVLAVTLSHRFVGQASSASDQTRIEEMRKLSDTFVQYPIAGTGMGSSVPGYRRSTTIPYSYEVQWYAMAMQFGIFGLSWLIVNFYVFFRSQRISRSDRLYANAVILLWVAAGFTNPYLTAVGGAFGMCILLLRCFSGEAAVGISSPPHAGRLPRPPSETP
ncbi:MAG: O-antigen ligase family protein [Steroidobacteraceae bacterium]